MDEKGYKVETHEKLEQSKSVLQIMLFTNCIEKNQSAGGRFFKLRDVIK